jgi:hypothetical protein
MTSAHGVGLTASGHAILRKKWVYAHGKNNRTLSPILTGCAKTATSGGAWERILVMSEHVITIQIDGDVSSDPRDYVSGYTTSTGAGFRISGHLATALDRVIRAAALEEAAKYLEDQPDNGVSYPTIWRHAAAIRALKDTP